MIVHTKQFLSLFSYFREIICICSAAICVKESEKKNFYDLIGLVGLRWLLLRTCFLQVPQVSVSHCVSTNLRRGVQFFGNVKWIESFLLCQLFPTQIVYVLFTYIAFFFSLIKCGCSGLEVISFPSFYGGCRCEWVFWLQWPARVSLGCSGLSRSSLFEDNLLRLMTWLLGASVASRVSFGLQWPLEIV